MGEDGQDNVRNLNVARFNKIADPAAHDPTSALDAALEWIKSLDEKPQHIVVFVGQDFPDGSSGTRYFQAGSYRHHAQQGLCLEGIHMLRESD